jgi:DNA polymerase-3 subunit alpha
MAKHGKVVVEKLHPVVTEITKHTNGQIVYQEQILRTVRELGGFTWEEAALVRKLISKKQGEQAFNRLQSKFMEGAAKLGVKDTIAGRVWKQLVTAGAYAFNAAHCVSYGMLAYWTMWLKQNHPLAFYRAALLKYDDKDKQLDIMREMAAKGIKILPPDPALSQMHWIITDVGLLAGFADVKGFGEKTAEAMLAYRRDVENDGLDHDWSWDDYINVKGIGPVTMQAMKEFCAADDPFGIHWLERHLDRARRWLAKHGERAGLPWPSSRSEDVPYEAIRGEHSWIGIVVHRNLKDIYELHQSRTGEELDPATVKQPEYPNYAVVTGMDETGPLTITIPRWQGFYDKHKDDIWDLEEGRDLLLVTGYKRAEYRRAITATEVHVLAMEE